MRSILPQLEKSAAQHAAALEVIRASDETPANEKIELDRTLMHIYHVDLGDPAAAWTAGLRVVSAEPSDTDVRVALAALAGQLGRDGEWARQLATALATLKQKSGAPAEIRTVADRARPACR